LEADGAMIIQKPFRLRILIALTDLLRAITPANGFQFDLSTTSDGDKRVVRGRLFLGDSEPPYMISLIEPPSAVEPRPNTGPDNVKRATEWDILIQGWARDAGPNEECDLAYALVADVHKALAAEMVKTRTGRPGATNILGFGDKITKLTIGTPVVRPSEEVSGYGQFFTILTMQIVEDMADPLG